MAKQFRREIYNIQTSIINLSSDLGVGKYNIMLQEV